MAIVFDAATLLGSGGTHTGSAGASLAVVLVHGAASATVTYGGVNCSPKTAATKQSLYFLVNPPTSGPQTVTFSAGGPASVLTFTGTSRAADPFRDADFQNSVGGTSAGVVLDSLAGDVGVGGGHSEDPDSHTLSSGDIQRTQSNNTGDPQTSRCSGTESATGASVTLSAVSNHDGTSVWFCGATIKPAPVGNQVIWL